MKNTFILLICALLAIGCSQAPKEYTISGVIKNSNASEILISAGNGTVSNADTVKLAEDGSFTYSTPIEKAAFGFIYVPGQAFYHIIAVGGTNTYLEADAAIPTQYKYTGDLEKEYGFQFSYLQMQNELSGRGSDSFKELYDASNAKKDSLFAVLETLDSKDYIALQKEDIEISIEQNFINYHSILRAKGADLDSDSDYNAYMEQLKLESAMDAIIYLEWKEACRAGIDNISSINMLKMAKEKITDPKLLENVAMDIATSYFYEPDANIDAFYEKVSEMVKDPKKLGWITDTYDAKKKTVPGAPALECDLENPQGEISKFSSLYGKVLYIDVWATWCGPCCEEIPYIEKLVEQFKGEERLQFVSISIDADKDAWRKKLADDNPQWAQYLNQDFTNMYGITGIPCFILIDKEGKIITTSAPRPSDSGIAEFLKSNL